MYLYGASGHSKVVIDIVKAMTVEIQAIIDDFPKQEKIQGIPVVHASELTFKDSDQLIVSIGNNAIRKKIVSGLSVNFSTAIHPSAIISPNASINKGTVVMPGVIINSDAVVGEHCIINSGAVVEHDCKIGNFSHVSPNASLAGGVTLGEGTHVGIGAAVIQGVKIGKWVTIGAGTVIINDIPDYAVVVGSPGKIIKYNSDPK